MAGRIEAYRKKPVVITAIEVLQENVELITEWLAGAGIQYEVRVDDNGNVENIYIATLEGVMQATKGDFLIKGVKGEFYPCKPDIFAETYELEVE